MQEALPTTDTGPSLRLLVLRTGQLERLREFYARLGIAFVAERHGDGPLHYAGDLGGATLELYPIDGGSTPADLLPRLGFAVCDLRLTLDAIEAAGGTVSSRPRETEWGYRAVVRDPDGRAVELYQDSRFSRRSARDSR